MSSYHDRVMNVPCEPDEFTAAHDDLRGAYATGHHAAKESAAEIAAQADAEIELWKRIAELEFEISKLKMENERLRNELDAMTEQE